MIRFLVYCQCSKFHLIFFFTKRRLVTGTYLYSPQNESTYNVRMEYCESHQQSVWVYLRLNGQLCGFQLPHSKWPMKTELLVSNDKHNDQSVFHGHDNLQSKMKMPLNRSTARWIHIRSLAAVKPYTSLMHYRLAANDLL